MQQAVRSAQNQWLPPPMDVVKINFDGATSPKKKKAGIGVVVRDVNGLVLASCAKIKHEPYKAVEIESLVAATTLSLTTDLGFQRVILERDSMEVIQALRENTQPLTPTGLPLEDVRRFSQNFDELLFSHTKRDGNIVAHSLAKYALSIPDFLV
ncbi:uncharacterized protein LOC142632455 [Castanea sativa]|uniref:uncharacterized protein LOC142632455 n=1 Tax=Castanea sativa TaxID=21020 RepID=UPI003F64C99C